MSTAAIQVLLIIGLLTANYPTQIAFAKTGQETTGPGKSQHLVVSPVDSPAIVESARNWHAREGVLYQRNWGVDIVGVKRVASGYMLDFRYRVLDPKKAVAFGNKKVRPYLIDEETGNRLSVPSMENIGEVRQVAEPEVNRTYFMLFGNPGKLVQSGGRVTIVVGEIRVTGLTVD
jgi:hypothetical protein